MLFTITLVYATIACVFATDDVSNDDKFPIVQTAHGKLRGSIIKSLLGKSIYSFRGVRYAQPPVGNLRLKPPAPLRSWKGVQNATEDGAVCMQIIVDVQPLQESEDCLFLNVYSTKLPTKRGGNPKRPVVVFFHEGAWVFSAGHSALRGPQYLMDQDIVLVTLNYRLGALGFLSTKDEVLPGNYGLKDQVAALRWVQQNIASFGGDPDSVTIMGYSAGSHSVLLHMLSPMSEGLFHRSIAMSGAMVQDWAVRSDADSVAKRHAAIFNCPNNSSEEIYECFMKQDPKEIATSAAGLVEWGVDPLGYTPVIEDGENAFLTGDPTELYLAGKFQQVPLMLGVTRDEFDWRVLQVLANETLVNDVNDNFDRVAPITFMYERNTPHSHEISRELQRFYLNDEPLSNDTMTGFGRIYSDSLVNFGITRIAKLISSNSSKPVFFYCFAYEGRYSYIYKPETTIPFGVDHHDDTIYLFFNSVQFPFFTSSDPEFHEVKKITKLWANFIQTGNPTPRKSDLLDNVLWKPFTEQNLNYLDHGSKLEMKQGLFRERMQLWERLFPLPEDSNQQGNT